MNSVVDEIREEGRLESSIQAAKRMLKESMKLFL